MEKSKRFCWFQFDPLQIPLSGRCSSAWGFPQQRLCRNSKRPSSPCDNKHRCYPCLISHMNATLYGEKCAEEKTWNISVSRPVCPSSWEIMTTGTRTQQPTGRRTIPSPILTGCRSLFTKSIKTSQVGRVRFPQLLFFTKLDKANQVTSKHIISQGEVPVVVMSQSDDVTEPFHLN